PVNGTGTPRYFPVSLTFVFKLLVTLHDVFLKNFHASPHGSAYISTRLGRIKTACVFYFRRHCARFFPFPFRKPEGPVPFGTAKVEIFFLPAKLFFLFFLRC